MNITSLESLALKFYKLAAYPTQETVATVVKNVIDKLISNHPDLMKGVLYASNIQLQNQLEYMSVGFLLDINENPQLQQALEESKSQRAQLVKSSISEALQSVFREFTFKVHFSEFPTNKPGFFSSHPE